MVVCEERGESPRKKTFFFNELTFQTLDVGLIPFYFIRPFDVII